jgi:peptidyl-prolyl cis-trans isomerase SurA
LTPEFAAAAFDLNDPQRVSRIVEDEYGFHIIQLDEKRGDRIKVRHILLRPFVSREEIATSIQRLDSVRNDIVNEKFTFEEVVYWVSSDRDTKNNKGLMVNSLRENSMGYSTRTGTSRFEMSELPPEISRTINTMAVGEISKPFTMINSKNREIVAIVKLRSRTEGHVASLSEDFQAIKSMVEAEKRDEILDKWISKKISETYIRINDNWRNCDFQRNEWLQQQ